MACGFVCQLVFASNVWRIYYTFIWRLADIPRRVSVSVWACGWVGDESKKVTHGPDSVHYHVIYNRMAYDDLRG